MRNKIKDKNYFRNKINYFLESENKRSNKLKNGLIKPERIVPVKQARASNLLSLVIAKYSVGDPIQDITEYYKASVNVIHDSWDNTWKIKNGNPSKVYNY